MSWRPVSEAKENDFVLFALKHPESDGADVLYGCRMGCSDSPRMDWYVPGRWSYPEEHVLGWMPLPEPPKERVL